MAVPPHDPPSSTSAGAPSSSHRLPTVWASAALQRASESGPKASNALTGIASIDHALGNGFESGKVTELWGPMGAGKTAIALRTASTVLSKSEDGDGGGVLWIDCAAPLSTQRLHAAVPSTHLEAFFHTAPPSLTHLLALLLHPPTGMPPEDCGLVVLTNLHTALEAAHPRHATFPASAKLDAQKWAAGRRYSILGTLITSLNRLAAAHNLPVLVTTGCATRSRSEYGGPLGLVPGVGGSEWEAGIWTRAAVFRDFGARYVGVQKVRGTNAAPNHVGFAKVAGFAVDGRGLAAEVGRDQDGGERNGDASSSPSKHVGSGGMTGRKRAFDEVADSDDEEGIDEYGGWDELEESAMAGAAGEDSSKVVVTLDD